MVSIDFTDKWERGDIKLIVMEDGKEDGKTLYANQVVLGMWSPVFDAMFKDGRFKEGTTNEVELPGKDYDDMLELLKVIHPPNFPVTLRNAYELLPLAHEYQIQDIVERCEDTIITDKPKISNVKLADDYGLRRLRNHCLETIGTYFPLADIIGDEDYVTLSEASKHDLLCKRISTIEAQLSNGDRLKQAATSNVNIWKGCDEHGYRESTCEACIASRARAFYESLFKPST